jgi:tRNA A-37 threonylcarbamoyl transferase component Bud32
VAGDATIVSGRRVAERYRLVEPRGDNTWDAVDETLKRHVVVHLLKADADEPAKAHFTAEARTLARLNHRNVVSTYDTGVDGDGVSYRVDELAGGTALDLHAVDDAHRLSFAHQITQAIADAHAIGLVHGAVTSANVFVDDEGRVKVRGLRLPTGDAGLDAAKTADVDALVGLIVGLAPPGNTALRDLAVGWRKSAPASAAAMRDALAAIDDDALAPEPLPTPATGVPRVAEHRQRRVLIVGLAAAAAAAVAAALILPTRNGKDTFEGPTQALTLTAKSFDPEANPPTENEADARLAVDGSAGTAWETERYRSAHFGRLKDGLGLILQVQGGSAEFDSVAIASPTRGWDVQIFVADQPAATLAGWGKPVASTQVHSATTTLALPTHPAGGAVLVWIPDPGQNLQVRVNEVTVQGRA